MSGRRINDYGGYAHTSDMQMKTKNSLKEYRSAEGSGGLRDYPDTSEEIMKDQKMGDSKAKGHPMKSGYRY